MSSSRAAAHANLGKLANIEQLQEALLGILAPGPSMTRGFNRSSAQVASENDPVTRTFAPAASDVRSMARRPQRPMT